MFLETVDDHTAVLIALGNDFLTTAELEKRMRDHDLRCPDDLMRLLSKMRKEGVIGGEWSSEKRSWIWWAKKEKE